MADELTNNKPQKQYVIGLFKEEDQALSAVAGLKASDWDINNVYTPIPSKKLAAALGLKKSKVGYFTLVGGIIGFFAGLALSAFSAKQWELIVQGKPIISLIPFFIVSFELTILFSVIANVIGFLFYTGLPKTKLPLHYYPDCSGDLYGIVASCNTGEHTKLMDLFNRNGGEARIY